MEGSPGAGGRSCLRGTHPILTARLDMQSPRSSARQSSLVTGSSTARTTTEMRKKPVRVFGAQSRRGLSPARRSLSRLSYGTRAIRSMCDLLRSWSLAFSFSLEEWTLTGKQGPRHRRGHPAERRMGAWVYRSVPDSLPRRAGVQPRVHQGETLASVIMHRTS